MNPYRLSRRAKADLDDIWTYTEARWGVEQAADYARELQTTIEMIVAHPEMGRAAEDLRPGYRRCPAGSHTIFYRVGARLEIVRVLRKGMNAKTHLG